MLFAVNFVSNAQCLIGSIPNSLHFLSPLRLSPFWFLWRVGVRHWGISIKRNLSFVRIHENVHGYVNRVGGQPASQPQSFVVAPIGCYKSPVAKTEIWNLVLLRHDSWKGRWKRYARRFELKMQGGFSQILLQFQCWDQIINPHHEIAQVLSTRVEFSLGLTWEAIVKGESAAMWWWGCPLWLFVFRTLLAQNTEIIQGPNS